MEPAIKRQKTTVQISVENMKDLYFLLSSPQGIALSQCYSFSTSPEPDWQVISRLVAFMSNIFPDQAEIQFSDGRHAYFTKLEATKYDSHYFITIFAEDGPLVNEMCLCRYLGSVGNILFQKMLSECLVQLEEKSVLAIQNSTYLDTIQSDSVNGDGTFEDTHSSLHDAFPTLMDCLGVFEEHFIKEVLTSDEGYSYNWFQPVSEYIGDWLLTNESSLPELYVVYRLSPNNMLFPIMTIDVNQICQCEQLSEDLRIGLTEYAHAKSSSSICANKLSLDEDWKCQPSHVLNISTTTAISEICESFDPSSGLCFAVSHFKYVCGFHLLILTYYNFHHTHEPLLSHLTHAFNISIIIGMSFFLSSEPHSKGIGAEIH